MYLDHCKDLQELRSEYRRLAMLYHPDKAGIESTPIMQAINAEYEVMAKKLAFGLHNEEDEIAFDAIFKEKIAALINLEGLIIEIIGDWIWVTGNTREHKEVLKQQDFKFASKKVAWYFKTYPFFRKGKETTLDEIRTKYGSEKVTRDKPKADFILK